MKRASVAAGPRIGLAPAGAGAGFGLAGADAPLPESAACTSSLVTRPRGPEPARPATSTPLADAMRAATGVALTLPFPPVAFPGAVCASGSGGAAGAGAPSPGAMRATTVPVATTSSGFARISTTVPATGDGSSASTLSVEISTRPWSRSTTSPTFTSQSRTVPSETDSPISGTATSTTSVAGGAASCSRSSFASCALSSASAPYSACSTIDSSGTSGVAPFPAAAPSGEISARTVPTGTVSSGSTRIFVRIPAAGEGTSVSTLSVETSTIPSSSATSSPTCFSHSRIVPSVTDSPISGMVIWIVVVPASIRGFLTLVRPYCQAAASMATHTDLRRLKFWGWGHEDQQPPPEEVQATATAARAHLGFEPAEVERPVRLEDLELPPPRIEPPASLAPICSSDPYERATHSYGKAYRDIVRAFRGRIDNPPDVVARPRDEADVERLLDWCASAGAAAIPFGGGTSVVGGVEPRGLSAAVSIDMRGLGRVLEVDPASRAALIQAGATGPRLEEQLREHGLTLRHFPQSFEYSTLGGWIVTRAGGHFATLMTHIDELVESLRAITPSGVWESRRLPGSGAGPSPDRMLIGSEGILGVVTQAWMRLQDAPRFREGASVYFSSFEEGAEAVRALSQSGLWPSNCRLLDPSEAALTGAAPDGKALLVLGFESADHPLDAWIARALECCADCGGEAKHASGGGGGGASAWRNAFLQAPYL